MIQDHDVPLLDIPDCDDILRRLSDLLRIHKICRRRACRRNARCQGGYGPPCYLERRHWFVEGLEYEMDECRAYWDEMRLQAALKRPRARP